MAREACRLVADPRPYPLGDRCEDGRIDEWPPGDGRVRKSSLSPGVSIARSHVVGARSLRWPTPYPNAEQWALGFGVSLCTLLLYFILFGRRHRCVVLTLQHCSMEVSCRALADRQRSQSIEADLAKAKAKVAKLEQTLLTARASESRDKGKEVRWSQAPFSSR